LSEHGASNEARSKKAGAQRNTAQESDKLPKGEERLEYFLTSRKGRDWRDEATQDSSTGRRKKTEMLAPSDIRNLRKKKRIQTRMHVRRTKIEPGGGAKQTFLPIAPGKKKDGGVSKLFVASQGGKTLRAEGNHRGRPEFGKDLDSCSAPNQL